MFKRWFVLLFCLFSVATAHAGRILPATAQPGDLKGIDFPYVKIGDNTLKLAPGLRIFDVQNRMVFYTMLPAEAKVFYQLDLMGQVLNLWLATPEEAATFAK